MTARPVIPRERAVRDIDEALDHYVREGGVAVALGFIDALERAYRHIASNPASGSPRHALELNLPGLRSWQLERYPHLIFYLERNDHIDVWRVLHGARDVPASMRDEIG
ncbi:MAG: type II toxin-antitoxin system RelE/ParE family toxin [Rhodospirillaceae bacterium]|nr:type II toxin-antitoxin system RelE/ParE family toxin [Rhodospirillaceae bacterium]